ncbi:MAG: hypothetical protein NTV22_11500 [bacterium]|nr:hypothetical protein [bacterium]
MFKRFLFLVLLIIVSIIVINLTDSQLVCWAVIVTDVIIAIRCAFPSKPAKLVARSTAIAEPCDVVVKSSSICTEPKPDNTDLLSSTTIILGKETRLPLTLIADNIGTRQVIEELFAGSGRNDSKRGLIESLVLSGRLTCPELDRYVKKYASAYEKNIAKLKQALGNDHSIDDDIIEQACSTWPFSQRDISLIYKNSDAFASRNIELLMEFGFSALQTYLFNAGKVINAKYCEKTVIETLTDKGLVAPISEAPMSDILCALSVDQIRLLCDKTGAPRRRSKAEMADEIVKIAGNENVLQDAVRDLPLLLLRDEKRITSASSHSVNADSCMYSATYSDILIETHDAAVRAVGDYKDSREYTDHWSIFSCGCPCCKKYETMKWSKKSPPKIPFHIGCTCLLQPNG